MRKLRFLVPAATLLAILASSPADAGWGHHHRHGGSYGSSGASYGGASYGGSSGYASYSGGSYGSSGASSGGSYGSYGSGGSSGGPGLLARLHARIHSHVAAKRARHASHGSSGYSSYGSSGYSSYGSSGYTSYKSHGSSGYSSYGSSGYSSYGSSGYSSYGGSTYSYAAPAVSYGVPQGYESAPQGYDSGVIIDQPYGEGSAIDGGSFPQSEGSAPQNEQGEAPAAEGEASEGAAPAEASIRADSALITLAVPASARVTVNGRPTTSEGPIRQFMSRGLKPGFSYSYLIEVEAMVDGRLTSSTKTLRVRAGDKERVVFDAPQATDVETALTVRVPADAKVILAGNPTSAEGETRVFRTQQLTRGQVWNDYEVVVTVVRDGRELTKKQVLQLVAGSERELAFSFDDEADAASLAAR